MFCIYHYRGRGQIHFDTYSQTLSHIRNKYKMKLRKQVETKMCCVKLEQKRKNYCSNICRYSFENKIKLNNSWKAYIRYWSCTFVSNRINKTVVELVIPLEQLLSNGDPPVQKHTKYRLAVKQFNTTTHNYNDYWFRHLIFTKFKY